MTSAQKGGGKNALNLRTNSIDFAEGGGGGPKTPKVRVHHIWKPQRERPNSRSHADADGHCVPRARWMAHCFFPMLRDILTVNKEESGESLCCALFEENEERKVRDNEGAKATSAT